MIEEITARRDQLLRELSAIDNRTDLEDFERESVGKRSPLIAWRESIKTLQPEQRPVIGKALNEFRDSLVAAIAESSERLSEAEQDSRPMLDLTLPSRGRRRGTLHLVTQVMRELEDIFVSMGYSIAEGPEVETDWYNFEALNFPKGHPARAMQDTLYVDLGEPEQVLLRTHTSPVQIRVMESTPPPIYSIMPGRVYRRDTLDARHSPVFHQIEGLVVDEGISMADLVGTIEAFLSQLFGKQTKARVLPSYFPFTEPSAEFGASCVFCSGSGCAVCSQTGWLELGGCGMVDPNVFAAVGLDPERWQGFAFGFGIERIAQLRHGVDHIKTYFENDIRFLRQF
ncbi:MAG: phenylalanine--tRNA ligase subunit alpha [Acidimicrobiia bacterium]